jgi:hypothetical protein
MIKVPKTRYAKKIMVRRKKVINMPSSILFLLICHHWAVGFWYVTDLT